MQTLDEPFLLLFGEQQEQLLLKSDLWVRIPSLPPRGDSYHLETSFPVANYESAASDQRHVEPAASEEDTPTSALSHFDPPKWETGPAFLGAAIIGRLLVRGLGDRLQTLRFRFTPVALSNGEFVGKHCLVVPVWSVQNNLVSFQVRYMVRLVHLFRVALLWISSHCRYHE